MIIVGNIISLGKCCTCMHTCICIRAPTQQCMCTQEARQSWKRSMFTETFYTYLLGVGVWPEDSVWESVLSSTMCHSELEFAPNMTLCLTSSACYFSYRPLDIYSEMGTPFSSLQASALSKWRWGQVQETSWNSPALVKSASLSITIYPKMGLELLI